MAAASSTHNSSGLPATSPPNPVGGSPLGGLLTGVAVTSIGITVTTRVGVAVAGGVGV
jgi:hypothetical protein